MTAFLLATLPAAIAQSLPKTEEVTLAGNQIDLETSLKGNTGILILGFSKKSEGQVREWTKALLTEFSAEHSVVIFEMPILEGMPRLVRGMALRSMKNATSPTERDHFLPVFHNEMQWKQVAQFSEPDDAYIVMIDRAGKIVWREHGSMDDKRKTELIGRVRALLSARHSNEPPTLLPAGTELSRRPLMPSKIRSTATEMFHVKQFEHDSNSGSLFERALTRQARNPTG